MKKIENFFNDEASEHDELFIENMGMKEFYDDIEKVLDQYSKSKSILVLGCGSGLEIERIKFPCKVIGIDISEKMLEVLKQKKLNENVELETICGSFLDLSFGKEKYDIVLSCYAMHHFNSEQKLNIYRKIYSSLTSGGVFINGDTLVNTQEEENKAMTEAIRIYERENMPFASLHVDVPFYWKHEDEVLKNAGFKNIELVREWTNTKIYKCTK